MVPVLLVVLSVGAAAWLGTRALRLERELAQQASLLDKSVARLSERDELLSTLLEADGELSVSHLTGSAGAGVTVYWNRRDGRTVLHAYGLRTLASGHVYALWTGDSARVRIATTFRSDGQGRALSQFIVPARRVDALPLTVTVEADTPGVVPSTPPVLTGQLAADIMHVEAEPPSR